MENETNKNNMSIRKIIIITYLVGIIVPILLIGSILFSNWISSTGKIAQNMSVDMNNEISDQINSFLTVPFHINEVNEKLIKNKIVDLSNEEERDKYFVSVLQAHNNNIYSFTYGMENGEYYGARRNEEGAIEIVNNNSTTGGSSWYYSINENLTREELVFKTDIFDVRTRDWYKVAKQVKITTFSPIYKHFVMEDLTISAATPIYDLNGNIQGVLGAHMILSDINHYIEDIVDDHNGYALVMENNSNLLIANSFGSENFTISEDGSLKRFTIDELNNELMTSIFSRYIEENENSPQIKTAAGKYFVNVTNYQNEGLDWIIISAIPSNLFTGEINENMKITAIIILITILIAIIIYFIIIKRIFKPIDNLILTSREIATGNLLKRATIVRNDEIGNLSSAFNFMADKLYQFVDNLEVKVKERTTKLELANEELSQTKEELSLILDTTAEGIFGIDMEGICIFCNDSCINLLGYSCQEDILGKNIQKVLRGQQKDGIIERQHNFRILESLLAEEKLHVEEEIFWKADGTSIDVEYHSYPKLKAGNVIGAVISFNNITEKKERQEQIEYLSCHDSLTGLLNRGCFENKMKQLNSEGLLPISIIFGDLNGLKLVNDIFGHAAGDMLIRKTAKVLENICGNNNIIARVGGDEFIVILPQVNSTQTVKLMAQIKKELSKEKVYAVKCSMALGFDTKTHDSENLEKIMGNAESEMYKEKLLSKKNYGIETIQMILKELQRRNPGEKEHSKRVASLCAKMGKAMGLTETEIKRLKDAGYIHDIGKIVLEEDLNNQGHSENEIWQVQQHSAVGYKILNLFDDTLDLAEVVYAHHEKWDGTGYPKGLKGEEIPLISRIISIINKYDKILTKMETDKEDARRLALEKIRELSGKSFDPSLVGIFIEMMKKMK